MYPADIHATLMRHAAPMPDGAADAADVHAVACILALALWEAGEAGRSATETTGLSGADLCNLAAGFFPRESAMFAGLRDRPAPEVGVDEACLRDLLRHGTTAGGLLELLLVHLAPGVEPLQDVDAALPEGLGDRGPWLIGNHLGGHVRHTTEPPAARPTVVQTRPAARGGVRSGPFVPWADH